MSEWTERAVPEIGRRASDRLLVDLSERVVRLDGKVDGLIEDHKETKQFIAKYLEKSEEVGDPHVWIKGVGAPTAKDFNTLKTKGLGILALFGAAFALVELAVQLKNATGH